MFGLENSANNFGKSAGLLANTTALRPVQAAEGTLFVDLDLLTLFRYDAIGVEGWQEIGGGGGIEGANNGLSISGTNVQLGGALLETTEIDITDGYLIFLSGDNTEYRFQNDYCYLNATSNDNDINASLQLQDDGSIKLEGNNNLTDFYGTILKLNVLGTGESLINNTFSANNGGIIGTISYDSYKADTTNTQLEHISNFFNDGEYFPITARFSIKGNPNGQDQGIYNFLKVPTYANNVGALAGGLVAGDIYRVTGTGNLHIVF